MLNLVKYLITNLVDKPETALVAETIDEGGTHFLTITVDPADMGRIIGKGGKIINSIRELVKVKAIKSGQRVRVVLAEKQQINPAFPLEPPAELPETG